MNKLLIVFCFMVLLISCSKNNNTNNKISNFNNDTIRGGIFLIQYLPLSLIVFYFHIQDTISTCSL